MERPASVVKELVENAIDAGSSAVVVEIRRGGMGMIRVTDNGCGIAPEELPTAFLRHATSKLRTEEDLGKIGTLGFRGEALAAISAVSRVDILTRQTGTAEGAALHLEGGVPGAVEAAGAPEGTTITVRDLFYNTPARLKFMRKDSAETAAVNGLMQHLALSHPDISFKFIKDGVEALLTPGDGKLDSAVYAALGRDFARGLVPVSGSGGDITVSGFVTAPLMGRGSRSMQVFFVNGRFIKSQLLTAALEEGYRNQIMKGKFPGCVLSVTLPVTAVDVNVHPAKTQVKFAREHDVFDAVYHTVLDALGKTGAPRRRRPGAGAAAPGGLPAGLLPDHGRQDVPPGRREAGSPARGPGPARLEHASCGRPPGWRTAGRPPFTRPSAQSPAAQSALGRAPSSVTSPSRHAAKQPAGPLQRSALGQPPASVTAPAAERRRHEPAGFCPGVRPCRKATPPESAPRPFVPAIPPERLKLTEDLPGQTTALETKEAPWRIAGEVLRTYIICESEDGCVWLIDKHAAHERINFDKLKNAQEPPMRQTLLAPIAAELSREDGALLLENLPLLEQFGFACEDFGGGALLVREVPADIDAADTVPTLEEFAERLRTGRSPDEKREALLHTMACKAAIKGGWVSDPAELRVLVDRVQSGEIKYCPHGRPVAVKLTKYELEKMFKRA